MNKDNNKNMIVKCVKGDFKADNGKDYYTLVYRIDGGNAFIFKNFPTHAACRNYIMTSEKMDYWQFDKLYKTAYFFQSPFDITQIQVKYRKLFKNMIFEIQNILDNNIF